MSKSKVYATRYGKVRVTTVKGLGRVITDPKGNVLRIKANV